MQKGRRRFLGRLVAKALEPAKNPYQDPVHESIHGCIERLEKLEHALGTLNRAKEQLKLYAEDLCR